MRERELLSINWRGSNKNEAKTGTSRTDDLDGAGGNDTLRGEGGNDYVNGSGGADVLFGGSGKDRVYISGRDIATGGQGADTFVLIDPDMAAPGYANAGTARIRDFDATGADHDVLELASYHRPGNINDRITFADRDLGLDDGFEMFRSGKDVIVRLRGDDGTVLKLILEDTKLADMTASDFVFSYF